MRKAVAARVAANATLTDGDAVADAVLGILRHLIANAPCMKVLEPAYVHSEEYDRLVEEPYRARRQAAA